MMTNLLYYYQNYHKNWEIKKFTEKSLFEKLWNICLICIFLHSGEFNLKI